MRADTIREAAATAFYRRFAEKAEELAQAGTVRRHKKTGEPNRTDVAEVLGIDQPTVTGIFKKKRMPRADRFAIICVMFGISADEMLGLAPVNDDERIRRLVRDLIDPRLKRKLYEELKVYYEAISDELESAENETSPALPEPSTRLAEPSFETGRHAADSGGVRPTKQSKRRKSPQ